MDQAPARGDARQWVLPVALPVLLVALILVADALEGPKTAFVGVLAVVPMFSAIFGRPLQVAIVGVVAWLAALGFGMVALDGKAPAQTVRLVIIAMSGVVAVLAARHRMAEEQRLRTAEQDAARAAQMRQQADTDQLTGALNRRGVLRSLGSPTTRPRTTCSPHARGARRRGRSPSSTSTPSSRSTTGTGTSPATSSSAL